MKLDPRPYLWGIARTTVDMLDFLVQAFDPNEDEDPEIARPGQWQADH
jgi:hypothetical protein